MTNEAVADHREPKYVCIVELFPNNPNVWKALADTFEDALRHQPFKLVRGQLLTEMLFLARFMIARKDDDSLKFPAEEIENLSRSVEFIEYGYPFIVDKPGKGITIERVPPYHNRATLLTDTGVYGLKYCTFIVEGNVQVGDEKKFFHISLEFGDLGAPADILPRGE